MQIQDIIQNIKSDVSHKECRVYIRYVPLQGNHYLVIRAQAFKGMVGEQIESVALCIENHNNREVEITPLEDYESIKVIFDEFRLISRYDRPEEGNSELDELLYRMSPEGIQEMADAMQADVISRII